MEQREENTEDIQRKIRKSSSSLSKSASSSLPVDLISEIFLKLPAKSILRFRSVSKLWSSITTNPYFTNSFETRPNLLLFFKKDGKFFAFKISQDNQNSKERYSYSSSQPIDSSSIAFPKHCTFTIKTESVHGLICFQKSGSSVLVWNPTIRKFLPLPLRKPDQTWRRITFVLGYDPVEGKHKVVCMPNNIASDACQILTLGSGQESWRMVKTNHKHLSFPCPNGRCIKGVLYYRANIGSGSDYVIMSFDVRSEEFNVIKLPWKGYRNAMMISYQGRLACIGSSDEIENSLLMWVLEDAEKHEWSSRNFLALSHYDRPLDNYYKLIGITNDGVLIYVPNKVYENFQIIYIDPVRERFTRVDYSGILDRDFRLRNGLEDKPVTGFQVFPNHIETLMPL